MISSHKLLTVLTRRVYSSYTLENSASSLLMYDDEMSKDGEIVDVDEVGGSLI